MVEQLQPHSAPVRPFGRRTTAPKVTITRGDRERSFYLRPWLSAAVGLIGIAGVGLTIGAGGYMLLHDDVVAVLSQRMGVIERSYEDRVGHLRTELDRAQSGKAIAEATLAQDIATLMQRQEDLLARHETVARIVGLARETRILHEEIATVATAIIQPPPPRPLFGEPEPTVPAFNSFAPVDPPALRERIGEARRTIDLITAEQDVVVDKIADDAEAFLGSLRSAIEEVPVPATLRDEIAASGGPYIPIAVAADDFAGRVGRAEALLESVQRLRSVTDKLPMIDPVKGRRSSGYGRRIDPINGSPAFHAGLDYAAPQGAPVRATGGGVVRRAGRAGGYGQMIEIDHGQGLTTRYAHLSRIDVAPGAKVAAGQLIGRVGSTGRSTGPHLHYETRRNGKAGDPSIYLRAGRKLASLLRR